MQAIWKIIYCAVVIVICYFAARISKFIAERIFKTKSITVIKPSKAKTLEAVTESLLKAAIYIVAVMSILNKVGVSSTSLAAVSGSIAVAIGLGAQGFISDIIAGIFILVEEQFNVGDVVSINDCMGTVEDVTIRTTRLRSLDGTVYIIPNGTISTVINKSKDFINAMVYVGIAYEEDIDHAIEVIKDEMEKAASEVHGLLETPTVLGITALDDSAVTIGILGKCAVNENLNVEREIRLRLKRRFTEENISIPYPQRTVHIVNASDN